MNVMQLLFSFDGRIRRLHYWLAAIGVSIAFFVVAIVVGMAFGGGAMMMAQGGNGAGAAGGGLAILGSLIYLVVTVAVVWIGLALQVKRWHDRDKSWVWIFINFIPFIGALWTLVECGFLDGTQGPNKYGPSPKGIAAPAAATA